MIAPLRETDQSTARTRRVLHRARHAVAAMLLEDDAVKGREAPAVPAWQAWLLTCWIVIVAASYFAFMLAK
ncbi:MAG: hypothetical protein ACYC35_09670 [Pirellulales bacterium]